MHLLPNIISTSNSTYYFTLIKIPAVNEDGFILLLRFTKVFLYCLMEFLWTEVCPYYQFKNIPLSNQERERDPFSTFQQNAKYTVIRN